jgi:hypothetical protein
LPDDVRRARHVHPDLRPAGAPVFRYFGFAVATVLVRLALTAPRIADAALGVVATLFAVGVTWFHNRPAQPFGDE